MPGEESIFQVIDGQQRLTWGRRCWRSCARTTGVAGVDYSAHGAQTGSPGAKPTVTKAFPRDISLACNVDLATGHLVRFHQERTGNSETIPPQLSEATEVEGTREFALTDGSLCGKIIITPSASGCTVSLVPNDSLARSLGGDGKWPDPDNPEHDPSDPRNRWDGGAVWPAKDSDMLVAYCLAFERFLRGKDLVLSETEQAPQQTNQDVSATPRSQSAEAGDFPRWWPKNRITQLRWKAAWKRIAPLHRNGYKIVEIARRLQINRDRVSHIIQWQSRDPTAH